MAKYYEEYGFIVNAEKEMTVKQWPFFREKLNQLKDPSKSDLEIYVDILGKTDGIKGMPLLLKVMMIINASTTSCEKRFSSMNYKKTCLRTCLTNETLHNILWISINGNVFKDFDPKLHLWSCLGTQVGRHTRGHWRERRKGDNEDSDAKKSVAVYHCTYHVIVLLHMLTFYAHFQR